METFGLLLGKKYTGAMVPNPQRLHLCGTIWYYSNFAL